MKKDTKYEGGLNFCEESIRTKYQHIFQKQVNILKISDMLLSKHNNLEHLKCENYRIYYREIGGIFVATFWFIITS